jgi:hypothetical protein
MSNNTITVELVIRDATPQVNHESRDIAELEATLDGLVDAIRDREAEIDALKDGIVAAASSVSDLRDVPLRDLEGSIQVIVGTLFDLTQ